jgi:type VI secretion system protein ImpA
MPLRADLLEPVAGESPAGASLRYDPVYDQIKQARTEDDDAPQGLWQHERKTADYAQVIKLSGEALAKRSKDLQLAAWMTEALLKREGFGGLADGLTLLRSLIEGFWDGLFPEIDEGDLEFRAAPLEWVGQYLDGAVRATPLTKGGLDLGAYRQSRQVGSEKDVEGDYEKQQARKQAIADGKLTVEKFDEEFTGTPKPYYKKLVADLDAARTALLALDAACKGRFADAAPSFNKLRGALDDVRQIAGQLLARKLELEPDPIEVVAAEAAAAAGGSAGGEGTGGGGGISPTPVSRDDALSRIAMAARFLRAAAPTEPAPYLMLRGLRWGELRARASLDPKLLVAPPTEIRSRLKGLLLDAKWAELLEAGEDVMAQAYGRGWLDLQRYVLTACDGLGSAYEPVTAAITGALRTLLRDIPDLSLMTMMDDTATANAETREWLRARGLIGGVEEEPEELVAPAPGRRTGGRDAYDRALDRVRAGEPQRAIELLLREAEQEKSERARFLRRAQAARVMVDAGHDPVALPILRDLLELIQKHTLEEWEAGDMVAQPLGLLYRCLGRLEPNSSEKNTLYLRICRLDPLQAMELNSAEVPNGAGV